MRDYTVFYKDGNTEKIEVGDRTELIKVLFEGSEKNLKSEVSLLKWSTANMFFTENVSTGIISSEITTADANPYGWRNEGNIE